AGASSPATRAWSSARSMARPRPAGRSSSPSADVSRLRLTFACCRYDRMEGIREGSVEVEGVDPTCITLNSGRQIFDRMVGGLEFDVSELSASEFISLQGAGDDRFVA